jgi:hypothetical protein
MLGLSRAAKRGCRHGKLSVLCLWPARGGVRSNEWLDTISPTLSYAYINEASADEHEGDARNNACAIDRCAWPKVRPARLVTNNECANQEDSHEAACDGCTRKDHKEYNALPGRPRGVKELSECLEDKAAQTGQAANVACTKQNEGFDKAHIVLYV